MLSVMEQDWFFFGLMFGVLLLCLAVDGYRLRKFRRHLPLFGLFFFGTAGLVILVYSLILIYSSKSWATWLLIPVILAFMSCEKLVIQKMDPFAGLVKRRLFSAN